MKTYEFWLIFHWRLFLRVELTISNIGSDNGLLPSRHQAIIWTNDGYFTNIYMSLSLSELMLWCSLSIWYPNYW